MQIKPFEDRVLIEPEEVEESKSKGETKKGQGRGGWNG